LHLTGNQLTDACLEHLKGLTKLKVLYIQNIKVHDADLQKLQQALPNCYIFH